LIHIWIDRKKDEIFMEKHEQILANMQTLAVFRSLLEDTVIRAFMRVLSVSKENRAFEYAAFVSELYHYRTNWSEYLFGEVQQNENVYVKKRLANKQPDDVIVDSVKRELAILESASHISSEDFKGFLSFSGALPSYEVSDIDFAIRYEQGISKAPQRGFGMFARYYAFTVYRGTLVPVKNPDNISLDDLFEYKAEREEVAANTRALLSGGHAANALLYGDAGTGKSSTVKALVNQYKDEGLRLIEVRKDQLHEIPAVMDSIADNPLHFILFIDDLSFSQNDDNFGTLKAILEGGIAAKTSNVAVYATSNRRHLVKESFTDRDGDDIHFNDTLEELASLSARFGLTVTFSKPDKELYLEIVHDLSKLYGLNYDPAIDQEAEVYAIRRGGRSPRIAKQFVEYLKIQQS